MSLYAHICETIETKDVVEGWWRKRTIDLEVAGKKITLGDGSTGRVISLTRGYNFPTLESLDHLLHLSYFAQLSDSSMYFIVVIGSTTDITPSNIKSVL